MLSEYWDLVWDGKLIEAMDYAREVGHGPVRRRHALVVHAAIPGGPDYFTHWGGAFKYAASVLGLPIGDYPHSRPPQAELPDEGQSPDRRGVSAVRTGR